MEALDRLRAAAECADKLFDIFESPVMRLDQAVLVTLERIREGLPPKPVDKELAEKARNAEDKCYRLAVEAEEALPEDSYAKKIAGELHGLLSDITIDIDTIEKILRSTYPDPQVLDETRSILLRDMYVLATVCTVLEYYMETAAAKKQIF